MAGPIASVIGVSATQYGAAALIIGVSLLALIPRDIRQMRALRRHRPRGHSRPSYATSSPVPANAATAPLAAAGRQQLVVRADLRDLAVLQHHDPVGARGGGQAVPTTSVVRCAASCSVARLTSASAARSRAAVASSSSRMAGSTR